MTSPMPTMALPHGPNPHETGAMEQHHTSRNNGDHSTGHKQQDHSTPPVQEGPLARESSHQTPPTSGRYDELASTAANNGGESVIDSVADDGRASQLPQRDTEGPEPAPGGPVIIAGREEVRPPAALPLAQEFSKAGSQEVSAAAAAHDGRKTEAGSQCGCTTPFKRLLKLLGGGGGTPRPKSLPGSHQDAKAVSVLPASCSSNGEGFQPSS